MNNDKNIAYQKSLVICFAYTEQQTLIYAVMFYEKFIDSALSRAQTVAGVIFRQISVASAGIWILSVIVSVRNRYGRMSARRELTVLLRTVFPLFLILLI